MSQKPTYLAAHTVAPLIEAHLAQHLETARARGEQNLAPLPEAKMIESIIDVAFWASLQREEGHSPTISLAFLSPEQAGQPLIFEHQLVLSPTILTKLSPAVERPGIHLGVWHDEGRLYLWGSTRDIPSGCFVLEVVEPGLVVVKHRRIDGFGKFVNLAVLKGDQIRIVDEEGTSVPDCPAVLSSLLGFTSFASWNDSGNVLVQLAASMRAHGRGGSLLVVPSDSDAWRESIIHPILYSVAPAFSELAELMRQDISERSRMHWQESLKRAVEGVAGLTAVDGATIINDQYELLAFGAKIRRPTGNPGVEQIIVTEPIVGGKADIIHPVQSGGTRHLSAAQFVQDQHGALALVASQDGRFTIFTWSPCEMMVHAHRVDALLL